MRTKRTAAQWLSWLLGAAAVILIPWMVVLGSTLPDETRVQHWAIAWIGLDVLLTVGCAATALLVRSGDERVRVAAAATASVAMLDAWFDVTTSAAGAAFVQAVACAGVELTLATLCSYLALRPRI